MNDKKTALLVCSGASNTGQITNEVAKKICKDNKNTNMICLAALPLNHKSTLEKVNAADKIIVINGCPVSCASKILEKYTNKKPAICVNVMEEYKIKKSPDLSAYTSEDIEKISKDILEKIEAKYEETDNNKLLR